MAPWTLGKRLAFLQLVALILAGIIWAAFTERQPGQLAAVLFWVGVAFLGLGIAIICGAWRGLRDTDIDLIAGPSHTRHARQFRDVKRAYSDLNLLALSGCISIILSVFL